MVCNAKLVERITPIVSSIIFKTHIFIGQFNYLVQKKYDGGDDIINPLKVRRKKYMSDYVLEAAEVLVSLITYFTREIKKFHYYDWIMSSIFLSMDTIFFISSHTEIVIFNAQTDLSKTHICDSSRTLTYSNLFTSPIITS
ncbi:hypothetical protein MXB_2055 [Myxobolus squamalis]|nr:hypothetical protein MXB_2055 [Myxobolus squamalis]